MSVATAKPVQRIRGPHLRVLVSRTQGVPFERALVLAEEANGVIASNTRLDKAVVCKLVCNDEWRSLSEVFAAWSGTMTAYQEPGERLGEQVEYVDPDTGHRWVFAVPEAHRNKKNAILVAEHPDYNLEVDGDNRVVHATKVDLVENFPAKNGWYRCDPKHDIPVVSQSSSDKFLWRVNKRVGPVVRGYYYFVGQCVGFDFPPSSHFGVAVEATVAARSS